jgi:hypothetical protein
MTNYKAFRRLLAILLLSLSMLAGNAFASEKVLNASLIEDEPVSMTEYFSVHEDPSTTLTLADMESDSVAGRFNNDVPAAQALSFGFTRSDYWLRFKLRNDTDRPTARMLETDYARLSDVQLHQPTGSGVYQTLATGSVFPFATRPYKNRNFVFPVTLPPHSE